MREGDGGVGVEVLTFLSRGWGLDSCGQERDGDKGGRARK